MFKCVERASQCFIAPTHAILGATGGGGGRGGEGGRGGGERGREKVDLTLKKFSPQKFQQ